MDEMLQAKDGVVEWKKNQHLYIHWLKGLIADLKSHRVKVSGWKKLFHANGTQNKVLIAILMSTKIDFKQETD